MRRWLDDKLDRFFGWLADQLCGEKDEWEYKHSTTPDD